MPYFGVDESSHLNFTIVINENYIDGFRKTKGPEAGGGPVSISKTNWNVWERNYVICYVSLFEPMSVCTELGTDFLSWIKNQPRAGQTSHRRCKSIWTTFANAKLTLFVEVYGWHIKTMLVKAFILLVL